MEASCLFLVAPVENTANMTVLFPCLFIREVERPPQQGLCRESASDFGTLQPQEFQADALFWVLVFNVCLGVWQNKHFYRARKLAHGKGSPGAAADGPMPSLGLAFLWDCEGELDFRGGGREVSLGTAEPGAAPRGPAGRGHPQTAGPGPASICPAPGRKTTKERKKIYIYII